MEKNWFILYIFVSKEVTKVRHGLLTGLNPKIELERFIEDITTREEITHDQIVILSMNTI